MTDFKDVLILNFTLLVFYDSLDVLLVACPVDRFMWFGRLAVDGDPVSCCTIYQSGTLEMGLWRLLAGALSCGRTRCTTRVCSNLLMKTLQFSNLSTFSFV